MWVKSIVVAYSMQVYNIFSMRCYIICIVTGIQVVTCVAGYIILEWGSTEEPFTTAMSCILWHDTKKYSKISKCHSSTVSLLYPPYILHYTLNNSLPSLYL